MEVHLESSINKIKGINPLCNKTEIEKLNDYNPVIKRLETGYYMTCYDNHLSNTWVVYEHHMRN